MREESKEQKKRVRQAVLARRDALSQEAQRRAACLITERLLGHQWFYRAGILLCYASYGSELDTYELIREALRLGKQVFVPRVLLEHRMEFYQIDSLEELRPGFHGILEPAKTHPYEDGMGEKSCKALPGKEPATQGESARPGDGEEARPADFEQALMLMPGVAYDPYGNRLGYGGGYYDRYLEAHPRFLTYSIGIGHSCQLVEKLPVEETDRRSYQVILV